MEGVVHFDVDVDGGADVDVDGDKYYELLSGNDLAVVIWNRRIRGEKKCNNTLKLYNNYFNNMK